MPKRFDLGIVAAAAILCFIGLVMIFSTATTAIFTKQFVWLVISVFVAFLFSRLSPRVWSTVSPFVYVGVVLLLIALLFVPGLYPKRWFKFGPISIQPSEFAKFATVVFLASYLAVKKRLKNFTDILLPLVIVSFPALLVFVEPDLGSSQIFFPVLLMMLYWAGMPAPKLLIFFSPIVSAAASFSIYAWVVYFALLTATLYYRKQLSDLVYGIVGNVVVGLMMPFIWGSLKTYQQQRIISYFSPWVDPKGMSWQIIQSKIAIGSGRIIGKGFLSGTQKKLQFLPERHTDFIFSCLGEEFGLIGIILTSLVFVFLLYRMLLLAKETKNKFASILVSGFFAWIGYQTFLNIGMTMGLLPITGVALPFISYGGSSLLACCMAIGVCIAVSRAKFKY